MLVQEETAGIEDWAVVHPITAGDWSQVDLEQFTLCFWNYNTFLNQQIRSL